MPRPFRRLAPLGPLAVAALCGCGGTDLAATEDTRPPAPPPAAPVLGAAAERPPAVEAAPPAPVEAAGWDFFGPPVGAAEEEDAGPAVDRLRLRGFWEVDGRRMAQLWAGDGRGAGETLLLAVGESRRGVTVVKLGGDTATVDDSRRAGTAGEPDGDAAAGRPRRVVLRLEPAAAGPSSAVAARRPEPRPRRRTPSPPRDLPPGSGSGRSPARFAPPPPLPPPPPGLNSGRTVAFD